MGSLSLEILEFQECLFPILSTLFLVMEQQIICHLKYFKDINILIQQTSGLLELFYTRYVILLKPFKVINLWLLLK